jgi:trk system potassium uptake protein TrkA
VGIIREDHPIAPSRDDSLEAHDELVFLAKPEIEDALEAMLSPGERLPRDKE